MTDKKMSLIGKALLLLSTIIWGSSFFILKNTIEVLPTYFVLAIRFVAGGLILFFVFFKSVIKINKKVLLNGLMLGVITACAYFFQTEGLERTTPAKNAFLTSWYCVLVPFFVWLLFRKKPTVYNIVAAILCMGGIGLISLDKNLKIQTGDWLTLVGGIFFAFQIIGIDRCVDHKKMDFRQLITFELLGCGAVCLILSLFTEVREVANLKNMEIPWQTIISLAYLTVFATVLAQTFQMFGQKYVHPSASALILNLEGVFGALFSALFYHEKFTAQIICGFIVVFIALAIGETKLEFIVKPIKEFIRKRKEKKNGKAHSDV